MSILIIGLFLVKLVLGDIEFGPCYADRGGIGVYKNIQECPFATLLLKNRVVPEVYSFTGLDAVVCCPENPSYQDIPLAANVPSYPESGILNDFDGSYKVNAEDEYGYKIEREHFGTCHLSDGCVGLYKNIRKCPYAITLLRKGLNPEVRGFEGFDVVVCCPNLLNYPNLPYDQSVPNISKDKNDNDNLDPYKKDVPNILNSPKFRDSTDPYRPFVPYVLHVANVNKAPDHTRIKDVPDATDNKNVKDIDAYRPPFPRIPNVANIPNILNGSIDTYNEDVEDYSDSVRPYISNGSSAPNGQDGIDDADDVNSYAPNVPSIPNDSNSPNNIRDDEDKTNLDIPNVPNVHNAPGHSRIKGVPDATDNKNVKDTDAYRPPFPRIPNVPNIPSTPNGPIDTNKENDKDNLPSHRSYISNGSSAPNVSNGSDDKSDVDSYAPNVSNSPNNTDPRGVANNTNSDIPNVSNIPTVSNISNSSTATNVSNSPDDTDNSDDKSDVDSSARNAPSTPNDTNSTTNIRDDEDKTNLDTPNVSNVTDVSGGKNEDDKAVPDVLDPTYNEYEEIIKRIADWETKNGLKITDAPGYLSAAHCYNFYSYYDRKVAFGTKSLPQEFPHMAVIGYDTEEGISWGCGGALISENFILTAAHCLFSPSSGSAKHVRLGDLDLESTTDDALPQQFRVKRTIAHPDYNPPFKYHDIGLIELDSKVNRTSYVNIACLDITRQNGSINLTTIGFGKTDYASEPSSFLMKADLVVYPHDTCQKSYKNDSNTLNNGIDDESMICAGGESDTCQGDSGGPLFYRNLYIRKTIPVYNIVGITSFGKACGVSKIPGVYTRVYKYLRWIEETVWPE